MASQPRKLDRAPFLLTRNSKIYADLFIFTIDLPDNEIILVQEFTCLSFFIAELRCKRLSHTCGHINYLYIINYHWLIFYAQLSSWCLEWVSIVNTIYDSNNTWRKNFDLINRNLTYILQA